MTTIVKNENKTKESESEAKLILERLLKDYSDKGIQLSEEEKDWLSDPPVGIEII